MFYRGLVVASTDNDVSEEELKFTNDSVRSDRSSQFSIEDLFTVRFTAIFVRRDFRMIFF